MQPEAPRAEVSRAEFLNLFAAVFLPMIHEPAARPTRETLRFMSANIYNNLFNAILLPLRSVRVKRAESYDAVGDTGR